MKQNNNALKILKILKKEYPNPKCTLNYTTPFELLVATILSAQCTDARVNIVTKSLFKKYKTAGDYAKAPLEELEQDIRSTGFYKNKAKSLKITAQTIISEFGGEVPNTMDSLLKLRGVARKTANVILSNCFNKNEGIIVDTHVTRLSNLLGLTKNKDAKKIEKDLIKIIPKKDWLIFSNSLVYHGRAVCIARKPKCFACSLNKVCPSAYTN